MPQPPLLPEETFTRVIRLAKADGFGVLAFSGLFALLAASGGDSSGAMVGLIVAGAGAIELHGAALLQSGDPRGMRWLIGSQLFLLVAIMGYCALRLQQVELPPIPEEMQPLVETSAQQADLPVPEYLQLVYRLSFGFVALAALIYQGGMTIYYLRRRAAVRQALEVPPQE
jgi:hypothetical protein